MASQGPIVVDTPAGVEVKGRRRLEDPKVFESVMGDLQQRLTVLSHSGAKNPVISDLDISQNKLTYEQYETLFITLNLTNVRVQRFRMFGCPTLNDYALNLIADYFRREVSSATVPIEMHLSDCAITTDGFLNFMAAIEENDAYPIPQPGNPSKGTPLYLRLENNYIVEDAIREKVNAGIIQTLVKKAGSRVVDIPGGAKIHLIMTQDNGSFQQRPGEPPAPENAPPPKPVNDKFAQEMQQGKGWGQWGQWGPGQKGGWQQPSFNNSWGMAPAVMGWQAPGWRPPMQHQNAQRPMFNARPNGTAAPVVNNSFAGKGNFVRPPGAVNTSMTRPVVQGKGQAASTNSWHGNAGTAADRSRTPVARNTKPPHPQQPPKQKSEGNMPHPWEEHFSEEYQIPYFWNSETGESLWERPAHW